MMVDNHYYKFAAVDKSTDIHFLDHTLEQAVGRRPPQYAPPSPPSVGAEAPPSRPRLRTAT